MRLSVYGSFEPALLARALGHWNERLPLFSSIEVHTPSRIGWGLRSAVREGELRVLVLDGTGLALATADGLPFVLQPGTPGSSPIVVLCPDASGPPDPAPLAGGRGEWIDAAAAATAAGVERMLDPESRHVAEVPFTDAFYLVLATAVFRRAHARLRPAVKVIAVDCDGTLWQGLCAEDGPEGVSVGPEELALHEALLAQKRAGRVLAFVTKNVSADVEAVFERRHDLGLSLDDVVALRAGWEPKERALRRLSGDLGLGLDTFLFIDDSAAECAAVSAALPEVAVLRRPMAGVRSLLEAVWPLDLPADPRGSLGATRTGLYLDEVQRRTAMIAAPSFSEYVESLELRVGVSSANADDEGRVFELAQRTNQFNTVDGRPTAEAVRQAIAAGQVLVARVADRFGDYGLCGVAILDASHAAPPDALRVERLLLSCRVLGRGVEEDVFDGLVTHARERGFAALEIALTATPRNLPARSFVEWIAGHAGARAAEDGGYRFALEGLRRWRRQLDPGVDEAAGERTPPDWRAPDWNAIAELTSNPQSLGVLLGLTLDGGVDTDHDSVDVTVDVTGESVLAVVVQVLGRPVSRGDNLYALGADSLRMARIIARLRSTLGVDVPIARLLHSGDVEDLIALVQRDKSQPDEDPDFMAQLESLYDEDDEEPTP